MKDYDVIDAFIGYLQEHGYPELRIDRYPDKENRTSSDIDAIAGDFAIEHTSIDTLPNQRRNADWFSKVTEGLEEEFADQLSFHLSITFDYGAIRKNYISITEKRGLGEIHQVFKNRIGEVNLSLADGCRVLNGVPDIPFQFDVIEGNELPKDILFALINPEDSTLPERIEELIDRSAKKLAKDQSNTKTTVLLIEINDPALMNDRILGAIRKAYPEELPSGINQIWYGEAVEKPIYVATTKRQNWREIRQAFIDWINEEKKNPRLTDGSHWINQEKKNPRLTTCLHWINNVPGIPFRFHVIKESASRSGVCFGLFEANDSSLSERLKELLDNRAEKLAKYQGTGKTTVLLLENNDIALMDPHGRKLLNAIRETYPRGLPSGVDKIWYADTAESPSPDGIKFTDFTPYLTEN
ncbi:hypothetical protein F4X88_21835 [Candidatus Poribacteria bacterium]|nr:hypothetical protein [Candidatus Poribacteria bacterium]MYA58925.1 hypothetical protein [Candidatus Poribacteria bacterium]